ncbi:MAG: metal-dependent transcriptional regulator [Bacillota bacterium]
MALHESAENYLEMILILQNSGRAEVHAVDVARALGFSKPSVSRAVSNLKEAGYLTVDTHGALLLTEPGRRIAQSVYSRHCAITQWLVALGVDAQTAAEDACRMEHVLSEASFQRISEHVNIRSAEMKEQRDV